MQEAMENPATVDPRTLTHLGKFADQISNAFQPTLPRLIKKIESELSKFALTLGELDMEMDSDDGEKGSEDFMVYDHSTGEPMKNIFITLKWKSAAAKIYDQSPDKLELSVTLTINEIDPAEFDTLTKDAVVTVEPEVSDAEKPVNEDTEQLDELSGATLGSYIQKARKDIKKKITKSKELDNDEKMTESEQLDELSKDTLKSYVKKSADSVGTNMHGYTNSLRKKHNKKAEKFDRNVDNRIAGINRATDKLAEAKGESPEYKDFFKKSLKKFGVNSPDDLKGKDKDEFFTYVDNNWSSEDEEALNELSKDTLKSYIKKAAGKQPSNGMIYANRLDSEDEEDSKKYRRKMIKSTKYINKAVDKLSKD